MTTFPALTHVALTVRDLSVSVPVVRSAPRRRARPRRRHRPRLPPHRVPVGNGTLLGLHQHGTPAPPEAFSEFRVGLDHVAFGCADRAELEKWAAPTRRARHRPRRHQGRGLRLGRQLPRPRRHRPRVLRAAQLTTVRQRARAGEHDRGRERSAMVLRPRRTQC